MAEVQSELDGLRVRIDGLHALLSYQTNRADAAEREMLRLRSLISEHCARANEIINAEHK